MFPRHLPAQSHENDIPSILNIYEKGAKLHYKNPDSAIYYYRMITESRLVDAINYQNLSESDITLVELFIQSLNQIGNIHYYNDEYKRAEMYYQRSLKLAKQASFPDFIGRALFDIGYIRYVNKNYTEAETLFEEAYDQYSFSNNQDGMYHVMNACGLTNYHLGQHKKADSCYQAALEMAIQMNDSSYMADINIHLGILYCEQQRLEEGMQLFEKALNYYESANNREAISDAYLNIGVVMSMAGDYKKALEYILASTEIEEFSQVKSQLVTRYYHLADIYLELNENKKAYEYCQKTLAVAEEIASQPFVAECNYLMGKYYMRQKEYENARDHFSKALEHAKNNNDKTLMTNVLIWYANALYQLNDHNKAINFSDEAFQLAQKLKMIDVQKDAAYSLYRIYRDKSRINEALTWFEVYHNVSDSINFYAQQKEIRRIEASYNYTKKEQENELLRNKTSLQEQKLKNRSITLFALALGIALSIAAIVILVNRIRYNRALNREQKLLSLQKLEDLTNELEGKERELASKMMFLNQKNELIGRIISQLQEMQQSPDVDSKEINMLVNELRSDAPQSNWKEFETQFVQVHPDFYKRLYDKHPDLTSYEQRICAFLRMNLNTKEIASITGRSAKSIEVTRSRIRKKLKLSRQDNLSSFLASI